MPAIAGSGAGGVKVRGLGVGFVGTEKLGIVGALRLTGGMNVVDMFYCHGIQKVGAFVTMPAKPLLAVNAKPHDIKFIGVLPTIA